MLSFTLVFTSCKSLNIKDIGAGNVSLTFSTFYEEGDRLDAYKDIISKFEESHKNIKINLQAQSNGYDAAINDAFQKGKAPDIMGLQRTKMIEYAKQGNLKDLSGWVNSNKLNEKYYGVNLGYGSYNGKYYGVGDLPYTIEWYYNVDLFRKAKLDEPETLDDLINACSKLKKYTSTPIALGAKDPWVLNTVFGMASVQTMETEKLAKAFAAGDKQSLALIDGGDEAVDVLYRLNKAGAFGNRAFEKTYSEAVNDFIKGRAAMLPMGSWVSEKIEKSNPKGLNYSVFELPVKFVQDPYSEVSATATQVITLNAKSKHGKEAEEFLSYLFSEEAQQIFEQKCGISGFKSVNNSSDDKIKSLILNHLDKTNENSTMYIDNISSKMIDSTANRLNQMFQNKQKPQDIWNLIVNDTSSK